MNSNRREVENLESLKSTERKRNDSLTSRISKMSIRLQTSRSKIVKKGLEKNLKELERQQAACKNLILSLNTKLEKKSRELESQRLNEKAYREEVHALSRNIISDAREVEKVRAAITEVTAAGQQTPEEKQTVAQATNDIVLKEVGGKFPPTAKLQK